MRTSAGVDVNLVSELGRGLEAARRLSESLIEDLDDAALRRQYHRLFSPLGWHFGHVVWQQEVWVLRRLLGDAPIDPSFDRVLDSFVSPKEQRGSSIPSKHFLLQYSKRVGEAVFDALDRFEFEATCPLRAGGHVFRFLANHEWQHAEIMTTVRRLGRLNWGRVEQSSTEPEGPNEFVAIPGGPFTMGSGADPESWDNERPPRRVQVADFLIQRHPVSNGEWLAFVEAGGYRDARLWTDEGNAYRISSALQLPESWVRADDGRYLCQTLCGTCDLDLQRPVTNISWHEALAYSRFCQARLPTEAEWEYAASWDLTRARKKRYPWGDEWPGAGFADLGLFRCQPGRRGEHRQSATEHGIRSLSGSVWEWVQDAFAPYPGFSPQPYEGYSQPWFDGRHRVARGGSFASAPSMARCSFRNWYTPDMREPALGLRLARDGTARGAARRS